MQKGTLIINGIDYSNGGGNSTPAISQTEGNIIKIDETDGGLFAALPEGIDSENTVIITKEEYDALGEEVLNNDKIYYITDYYNNQQPQELTISPFRLGIDENGNYGYYKDGADTVTPFKKNNDLSIPIDKILYDTSSASLSASLSSDNEYKLILTSTSSSSGYVNNRIRVINIQNCELEKIQEIQEHYNTESKTYSAYAIYKIKNITGQVTITSGSDSYGSSIKFFVKEDY